MTSATTVAPELPPLVLLDVDGVLNAFERDEDSLDGWERGYATSDGTSWRITYCPEVVAALRELHESRQVEIQWLTTWGHDANGDLRELLGLPELEVAGTYDEGYREGPGASVVSGGALAAVTPSAPDDDEVPRWWKWDVVLRILAEQPGRKLVWIDDELHRTSVFTFLARGEGIMVIGPDPDEGLQVDDVERITSEIG